MDSALCTVTSQGKTPTGSPPPPSHRSTEQVCRCVKGAWDCHVAVNQSYHGIEDKYHEAQPRGGFPLHEEL